MKNFTQNYFYLSRIHGLGSLSLLQGHLPTQGSNPGLPHCRQILYQLSHQGFPETTPTNQLKKAQ